MENPNQRTSTQQPHPLAVELGRMLSARGLTLALAESCTGGLIGSLITDVAGSSDYFLGSAVTYAYSAKEDILGVRHETLLAHGAVSAATAAEMAQGAAARLRRGYRSLGDGDRRAGRRYARQARGAGAHPSFRSRRGDRRTTRVGR